MAVVAAALVATALSGGVREALPGGPAADTSPTATDEADDPRSDDPWADAPRAGDEEASAAAAAGAAAGPSGDASADETLVTAPAPTTAPMARLDELVLHLPAARPLVVGYHEASHVSAVPMTPVGTVLDDRNTTRTSLPPDDPEGADYLVLTSRGRAAGPTSALDVVLPEGTAVLAPVSGTVLDVRDYQLYGRHEDLRIEIVPDGRPDLRLVLIHLADGQVEVGDRVHAGVTPLAGTARLLPFGSHIDRETEPDRHPHVHLELQPIDRPRPGDEVEDGDEDDIGPAPDQAAGG